MDNRKNYFRYFLVFFIYTTGSLFPQLDLDWKEMAALDYYEYKGPVFWNYYSTLNTEYKKNILRAKKLGCNMVRIPLNFIPDDHDPNAPKYSHGWVSPSELGTGKVFKNTEYLADINDLIKFCRENDMKVNLILFNHGLASKNCSGFHNDEGTKYQNYYTPKGTNPNWVDLQEMNLWFIDAAAWISRILNSINLNDIEVLEIRNEAYPNYSSDKPYPEYFYDIFLLEMSAYIRNHYPQKELMISLTQIDYLKYYTNLQRMLKNSERGIFKRPPEITYSKHELNKAFYYEYISFHNYNTYSYRKSFQDVLDLGRLQNKNYSWHFGEIGFDLSKSSETDQAKNYLSNFQIIAELSDKLKNSGTPVKGAGIWSVFDYAYKEEPGASFGITDFTNVTEPRKRKAAIIVENYFEGLIDNPGFEINNKQFGNEPNFNDSEFTNGWTIWHDGEGNFHPHFSIVRASGNSRARIKGSANNKLGISSSPGRRLFVKAGTKIRISVDVFIQDSPGSGRVFLQMNWYKQDGSSVGNSGQNESKLSGGKVNLELIVPSDAYSAELLLMAWNISDQAVIEFDNIKYTPEEIPLIELVGEDSTPARGWKGNDVSKVQVSAKKFQLKSGAEISSTNAINVNQTTAIRVRPGRDYSISSVINSSDAEIELSFVDTDPNDYPLKNNIKAKIPVKEGVLKKYEIHPVKNKSDKWLNVRIRSNSDNTEVSSFIVYEKNPAY